MKRPGWRRVFSVTNTFRLPPDLSIEQAVGVFQSGRTAIGVLSTVRIEPGASVLITAAAGSTGSLLLQLARSAGAGIVIRAACGKDKLALISHLGTNVAVDYSEEGWVEQVRAAMGDQGADVMLESVGGAAGRQAVALPAFSTAKNGR